MALASRAQALERVEEYLIRSGRYRVNHEKALRLPEVVRNPLFNVKSRQARCVYLPWLREIIGGIIRGGTIDGKPGWRYLADSGAIGPSSKGLADSLEPTKRTWYLLKLAAGGDINGLHHGDLTEFHLDSIRVRYPLCSLKTRPSNFIYNTEEKRLEKLLWFNEQLKKKESEMTPNERAVHDKQKAGQGFSAPKFLFHSDSPQAEALFHAKFQLGAPKSLLEINSGIKRAALECGVDRPGTLTSEELAEFSKWSSTHNMPWCRIVKEGGKLVLGRKPFFEFSLPTTREAVLLGADGELYLARREGGRIGIYLDEQVTLDGICRHPLKWSDTDIDKYRLQHLIRAYFPSIFAAACFALPEKMAGRKEWEMDNTPRYFFRNRLLFAPGKGRRARRRAAKWEEGLSNEDKRLIHSLPKGQILYMQDKWGDCYTVKKVEGGLEVRTDRRNKVIEAVEWLAQKYGVGVSELRWRYFGDQDLEVLLSMATSHAVLVKMARPGISASEMSGDIKLSDSEIEKRLLALYPDWYEWQEWYSGRKKGTEQQPFPARQGVAVQSRMVAPRKQETPAKKPSHWQTPQKEKIAALVAKLNEKKEKGKESPQSAEAKTGPASVFAESLPSSKKPEKHMEEEPDGQGAYGMETEGEIPLEVGDEKGLHEIFLKKTAASESGAQGTAPRKSLRIVPSTRYRGLKKDEEPRPKWRPGIEIPTGQTQRENDERDLLAAGCLAYCKKALSSFSEKAQLSVRVRNLTSNYVWPNNFSSVAGENGMPKISLYIDFGRQEGYYRYMGELHPFRLREIRIALAEIRKLASSLS